MLLHENDRWVLCDYGSVSTWAGVHETSNQIMIAEDEIRRHTTAAYRAPEASCRPLAGCRLTHQRSIVVGCGGMHTAVAARLLRSLLMRLIWLSGTACVI